jgi:hypothetical protein
MPEKKDVMPYVDVQTARVGGRRWELQTFSPVQNFQSTLNNMRSCLEKASQTMLYSHPVATGSRFIYLST